MSWRKQSNGNYQFNILRPLQNDTIRVEFPLNATIGNVKDYLRRYEYPQDHVYQASKCSINENNPNINDNTPIAQLKHKKVFAFLSCPINILCNSQWRQDHNGNLVFKVGFDDGNEVAYAMRPNTKIERLKHSICQRYGYHNVILIVNNVPVNDNVTIGSIEGHYIRGIIV
jgi:hypothetical protein